MTEEHESLQRLSESVEEWAELRDVGDDPYLQSLLGALESERDLDVLEKLDPLEYLPKPSAPQGDRRLIFSNFLTVIRNVLVFVPVAITWKAVAEATDAFGRFTEENSSTTVNFLQFWQNGYDYLDPFWGIANIAQIDFIVILAIIALTLFIGYLVNSAQQVKFMNAQAIDQERAILSLDIRRVLHPYRVIDPNQMSSETGRAIQDLSRVAQDIAEIASTLRAASMEMTDNRRALAELAADVEASRQVWSSEVAEQLQLLSGGVRDAGGHLEGSMRSLAETAADLRVSMNGNLKDSLEQSTEALNAIASQVALSGETLNANSRVLQDDLVDLHRRLQRLLADGAS